MKELSLLANGIDKTRHSLPLQSVTNASIGELLKALNVFETHLIEMPKMAKMAVGPDKEKTENSNIVDNYRETLNSLSKECLDMVDSLEFSGEAASHTLTLAQCSKLKNTNLKLSYNL